jgi:integrase
VIVCIPCGSSWPRLGCAVLNCWAFAGSSSSIGRRSKSFASWRVAQIEERLAAGEKWDDTGLVFTQATGAGMHPERVSRRFCLLRERAGLPAIRFHDLRHTYATLALQAGVPVKVVSERLGHKTTGITENLYLHVTPQMAEDAANTVANMILGNTGSGPSVNNP